VIPLEFSEDSYLPAWSSGGEVVMPTMRRWRVSPYQDSKEKLPFPGKLFQVVSL
jgi:hypothetical protein